MTESAGEVHRVHLIRVVTVVAEQPPAVDYPPTFDQANTEQHPRQIRVPLGAPGRTPSYRPARRSALLSRSSPTEPANWLRRRPERSMISVNGTPVTPARSWRLASSSYVISRSGACVAFAAAITCLHRTHSVDVNTTSPGPRSNPSMFTGEWLANLPRARYPRPAATAMIAPINTKRTRASPIDDRAGDEDEALVGLSAPCH